MLYQTFLRKYGQVRNSLLGAKTAANIHDILIRFFLKKRIILSYRSFDRIN